VHEVARKEKRTRFTALLHHVTAHLLRDSYYALKRSAAPGVDGMTWKEYETDLGNRLHGSTQPSPSGDERSLLREPTYRKPTDGEDPWASSTRPSDSPSACMLGFGLKAFSNRPAA